MTDSIMAPAPKNAQHNVSVLRDLALAMAGHVCVIRWCQCVLAILPQKSDLASGATTKHVSPEMHRTSAQAASVRHAHNVQIQMVITILHVNAQRLMR